MTTLNNLDELRALDAGTYITVGRHERVWHKNEEGNFTRNGYTLNPSHFTGELASGNVSVGRRPRPGDLYQAGFSYVLVLDVPPRDGTWVAVFNEHRRFMRLRQYENIPGELMFPTPDWVEHVGECARALANTQQQLTDTFTEMDRLRGQLREASRQSLGESAANYRARLEPALQSFADDCPTDLYDDLVDLMREYGMSPPTRTVTVDIEVEGTTELLADNSTLASMIGGDVTIEDASPGEMDVEWCRTFQHIFDEGTGCMCDHVDRPMVERMLADASVTYTAFDYSTSCSED